MIVLLFFTINLFPRVKTTCVCSGECGGGGAAGSSVQARFSPLSTTPFIYLCDWNSLLAPHTPLLLPASEGNKDSTSVGHLLFNNQAVTAYIAV